MAETTYKVSWRASSACAVEVTESDGVHKTVSPLDQEADAKAWIADERWNVAMGASKERPWVLKKPG